VHPLYGADRHFQKYNMCSNNEALFKAIYFFLNIMLVPIWLQDLP